MTREPLAYPGDPYNDPDYDEVAILKGEIERLNGELETGAQRLSDFCTALGQMGIEKAALLTEIERLKGQINDILEHDGCACEALCLPGLRAEVERLQTENTELRARAQEFYESWVKTRDALETVSTRAALEPKP